MDPTTWSDFLEKFGLPITIAFALGIALYYSQKLLIDTLKNSYLEATLQNKEITNQNKEQTKYLEQILSELHKLTEMAHKHENDLKDVKCRYDK